MATKRKAIVIIFFDDLGLSYDIDPPFAQFFDANSCRSNVVVLADVCQI